MNDGGPAFPAIGIEQRGDPAYNPPTKVYYTGMSLREHFAGQALVGVLAMCADPDASAPTPENASRIAVAHADALIAELNKHQTENETNRPN